MGIIVRQSLKSTLVSYTGVLLGAFNMLVLFPRFLEEDQFGLTRVLLSIAVLMAQLSEFGGANVIVKYFPVFRDDRETFRRFVFWILLKALAAYSVISLVIFFFRQPLLENYEEKSTLVTHFFGFIFPLAIFILLFNLMEAYARSLLRITIPTLLREVYLRIFLMAVILLYHFNYIDFNQFIYLFAFSYCSAMLIMAGYVFWLDRIFIKPSLAFSKHEMVEEIFVYGIFSILTGGVWKAVTQLDVIMLNHIDGLKYVGAYSIGVYIATLIQLPQRSLHLISEPIVAKAIKQDDWAAVKELFKKVSLAQFTIGLFLFLGIWSNLENLYRFLPDKYHVITATVLVLMLGKLFDMATGFNGEVIHYSKYYKFNLIAGIALGFACVGANLFFIPKYSLLGAAIGTSLSLTVFNIVRTTFIYFKFGFLPFSAAMGKCLLVGIGTLAVVMLIPEMPNVYLDLLVKSVVVTVLFLGSVYALKISDDINQLMLKMLNRAKSFGSRS